MTLTEKYIVIESKRLRASTMEFWDNGIICIKLDENSEVTLEDTKVNYQILKERYDGKKKHLVLSEPGRYSSMTKEAREFIVLPETNAMTRGSAVVIKSLASRIVMNFVISLTKKQGIHTKIFENKEKAIEWLLSLDQNNES